MARRDSNTGQQGRSLFKAEVGDAIKKRLEKLGHKPLTYLSSATGSSYRTVTYVAGGHTELAMGSRERWEKVLGWEPGSITHAYKTGEMPQLVDDTAGSNAEPGSPLPTSVADLLTDLPESFRDKVLEIIDGLQALGFSDDEVRHLAEDWLRLELDIQRSQELIRRRQQEQQTLLLHAGRTAPRDSHTARIHTTESTPRQTVTTRGPAGDTPDSSIP
jgi:hypothetical protein